jgi:hypothetical protein
MEQETYGVDSRWQNFADGMLAKEHEAFNVWAAINAKQVHEFRSRAGRDYQQSARQNIVTSPREQ